MTERTSGAHPSGASESDAVRYLAMQRALYADLVARSHYDSDEHTRRDDAELVVGTYSQHETFPYERWLLGGITVRPGAVGHLVEPASTIVDSPPDILIVSSLTFEDEMVAFAESLGLPDLQIVRCHS